MQPACALACKGASTARGVHCVFTALQARRPCCSASLVQRLVQQVKFVIRRVLSTTERLRSRHPAQGGLVSLSMTWQLLTLTQPLQLLLYQHCPPLSYSALHINISVMGNTRRKGAMMAQVPHYSAHLRMAAKTTLQISSSSSSSRRSKWHQPQRLCPW
jgi:hypothetical protein